MIMTEAMILKGLSVHMTWKIMVVYMDLKFSRNDMSRDPMPCRNPVTSHRLTIHPTIPQVRSVNVQDFLPQGMRQVTTPIPQLFTP